MKTLTLLIMLVISLAGCQEEVRWNEKLNRCQQVNEPYQIVPSSECGK